MIHLLSAAAEAFCGLYVGSGEPLHNAASQVVVAVNPDGTSMLTLVPDYSGDAAEFGLVVPVPAGTGDDDVRVVGPEALGFLAAYTAPRLVQYTCGDLYPYTWGGAAHADPDPRYHGCACTGLGCYDSGGLGEPVVLAEGVAVEEVFTEGSYEIAVLSAEDSTGLLAYLELQGYALDESASWALQTYIDQGLQFLVARVSLEASGDAWLTPLQIGYPSSEVVTVPIRLGTENATGPQDLELFVLADGPVVIPNHPQVEIERDCMLEGADTPEAVDAAYRALLDAALDAEPIAWTYVHLWATPTKCDPCPSDAAAFDPAVLPEVGYTGTGPVISRMHVRWRPDPVLQDLLLDVEPRTFLPLQTKFIDWAEELEGDFRVCGEDTRRSDVTECTDAAPARTQLGISPLVLAGLAWLGRRRVAS